MPLSPMMRITMKQLQQSVQVRSVTTTMDIVWTIPILFVVAVGIGVAVFVHEKDVHGKNEHFLQQLTATTRA
jgi:hypothetical protein